MAKQSRKPAGVGHNSQLADPNDINRALARQLLLDQEMSDLKERHKRIRKGFEEKGVSLGRLDHWKKLSDKPIAEIEQEFRENFHYASAVFPDLGDQFDLFAPKAEAPERRMAFYHAGRMAALKGLPPTLPPGIGGDSAQQWQNGYNESLPFYTEAKSQHAEFLAAAVKNAEKGIVTDGTGKAKGKEAKQAEQVREQARTDFKNDNPDVDLGKAAGSGKITPAPEGSPAGAEVADAPAEKSQEEIDADKSADAAAFDGAKEDPAPTADEADPLFFNGVKYLNATHLGQAKAKFEKAQKAQAKADAKAASDAGKPKSQSDKAADKRRDAGIH